MAAPNTTSNTPPKLAGVHPDLAAKIGRIVDAMAVLGWELVVTQGLRTQVEQAALYAQGRSAPGAIVTNADGTIKRSNHQAKADGFGHAVDVAFRVRGGLSWDPTLPWECYGTMGEALGLTWGGRFHALPDRPHLELPS